MTPAQAAAVLNQVTPLCWPNDAQDALRMGAEALELLAYLFTPNDMSEMRINGLLDRWHGEDDFLDWVREQKAKEKR
ncbi:MAG: hypothetical protein WCP82_11310 [Alphaproteobacteria bacterium]